MYSTQELKPHSSSIERVSFPTISKGLLPHPQEYECHYTPIFLSESQESMRPNQYFDGYNFFSSTGIESCEDTLACCMTAYNEPLIDYQRTISSLCATAEFFRTKGEERVSREFVISIIVDGIDKMSADFATWASDIGIYTPEALDPEADFHMFESQISRKDLYLFASMDASFEYPQHYLDDSLQRIILFIKNTNRGKLDSHKCFFDRICSFYSAKYFVQIDVGTTPADDALYKMWFELQSNPDIAATAARSLLPAPKSHFNLLQIWQYCDIAVERIVNWPSEIFLGSLSVLPGQLSLTRIASVIDSSNTQPSTVLDKYYRGLDNLNPFESNMYLAEDRILGQEMVFQKQNKWELSYQTEAEATVDACESWGELCRQRRRWICSSMACRIAMLHKLPNFFNNPSRSIKEKLHKIIAAIYFTVYSLLEWHVPAVHLILQITLINLSLDTISNPVASYGLSALGSFSVFLIAVQAIIAFYGKIDRIFQQIVNLSISIQTINIVLSTIILSAVSYPLLSLFILISSTIYLLIAFSYGKNIVNDLTNSIFQYMFCRIPVKSFLMIYSIFNAHDTSWGTKGLSSSVHLNGSSEIRFKYNVFRCISLTLFVSSNLLAVLYFYLGGFLHNINTIYFMFSVLLIQLIIAVISMVSFVTKFRKTII